MTVTGEDRAALLARALRDKGALRSAEWSAAVAAVPRHVFVPRFYEQIGGRRQLVDGSDPEQRARWLDRVYSDAGLTIALDEAGEDQVSSSSQPALMARMLEMLDIDDGHRVLEIGTGTGYNAALLCHRLGHERVFSVDIAADLVELAGVRLAELGHHPTLAVGDGADGLPAHAPYDRIIATCSVPAVLRSWMGQVTEGGLLLVDIKAGPYAGNLVLLRRDHDRLLGRFAERWATFMGMRHHGRPQQQPVEFDTTASTVRSTTLDPHPWDNLCAWFVAQLGIGTPIAFGYVLDQHTNRPTRARYTTADGSWCEVALDADNGAREVREGGARPLWAAVERAYRRWRGWGEPGWERFGLTVAADGAHTVWLDEPGRAVVAFTP